MLKHLAILALLATPFTGSGFPTTSIPPLDTKGDVYKTEGPNDPLIYGPTVGDKKAVLAHYPRLIRGDQVAAKVDAAA